MVYALKGFILRGLHNMPSLKTQLFVQRPFVNLCTENCVIFFEENLNLKVKAVSCKHYCGRENKHFYNYVLNTIFFLPFFLFLYYKLFVYLWLEDVMRGGEISLALVGDFLDLSQGDGDLLALSRGGEGELLALSGGEGELLALSRGEGELLSLG